MERTEILSRMICVLGDSLEGMTDRERLERNYTEQALCYRSLFLASDGDDFEIVCARCIISAARSLSEKPHERECIEVAKDEVKSLRAAFFGRTRSREIRSRTEEHIQSMLSKNGDEVLEAVLFLRLTLC